MKQTEISALMTVFVTQGSPWAAFPSVIRKSVSLIETDPLHRA